MLWEKKGLETRWKKQLVGDFEWSQLWERFAAPFPVLMAMWEEKVAKS